MIRLEQYDYIRIAHRVYGKGVREIARDTGHSRNTIRKALEGEYEGYTPRETQPFPVLGPYLTTIDQWLKDDLERPRKQRHTAVRIYNRLCTECGFEGSESTVRRYVQGARRDLGLTPSGVFIPLEPELGLEAEVDWGCSHGIIAGVYTSLKLFCMRPKGSGKPFVQCFPCERQQALFEGHMGAFEFYGGVFRVLIYDNLTPVVEKILKGKDRRLQESFEKFRAYYNFEARFCNPGQGHEKGGVEGLVGYVRRNFMVPLPQAESLRELNAYLLAQCHAYGDHRIAGRDKSVNEYFEEEKKHLLSLPEVPFSNLETLSAKVDKFSTVVVDKNRYSVPTRYAGLRVRVVLYVERLDIFYASRRIATHERLYGNNKWQLDPLHYLDLLERRPQAFESARPIRQWRPAWPMSLEKLLVRFREAHGPAHGTKEFIGVLMLFGEHGESEVIEAVEGALAAGVSSKEAVEHLLHRKRSAASEHWPAPLEAWHTLPSPDISVYSRIGGLS
jgi:transposase